MYIAWATDLHLDAVDQPTADRFFAKLSQSRASALLVSGDIAESTSLLKWLGFLECQLEMPIYFVLGNHDYYGSNIARVTESVCNIQSKFLCYLPSSGPVKLASGVSLVGHSGWGDCRFGDLEDFAILTDYFAIEDLRKTIDWDAFAAGEFRRNALIQKLNDLGEEAAEVLRPHIEEAAEDNNAVLVLTHVPPFRESCWHDGSISEEKWLPGFTCKAVGDLLKSVASKFTRTAFIVLCGHTHGSGSAQMLPNLNVFTGFGDYGLLRSGVVAIDGTQVVVETPTR